VFIGTVVAALVIGFLAGLLSFKVKTRWCPACGATLRCADCVQHGVVGNRGHLNHHERRPTRIRGLGPTVPKGKTTVITAGTMRHQPEPGARQTPVMETQVALIPGLGLTVRIDPCDGDVPLLEMINGSTRLVVTLDLVDVSEFNSGHAALAEELASARSTTSAGTGKSRCICNLAMSHSIL
jgi:hypothetical protein